MKKYLSMAAGAAVLLGATMGMASPANAQAASGPFADVPADHWAYQAVNTLQKAGIVIGYPDGTYGGRRAMTRYEFAVAIARLLPLIQQQIDTTQFAKTSDLQALSNNLNGQLQQQQAEIDALKALVAEFQPELAQLGQDVTAIDKRLDSDEARLAVVEAEQQRVKITGELNIIARGDVNASKDGAGLLDENGDPIGSNAYEISEYYDARPKTAPTGTAYPNNTSLWSDINVYHDFLLGIDGKVSDNSHVVVKIDAGNYLYTLENYEANGFNDPYYDDDNYDYFQIYRAYYDVTGNAGPFVGGELKAGRFGIQYTPYTLKAMNPDLYAITPETSYGDVTTDGLQASAALGPVKLDWYAGKNYVNDADIIAGPGSIETTAGNSGPYRPGFEYDDVYDDNTFAEYVNQSTGLRLTFGNPNDFTLGITGLLMQDEAQEPADYYGSDYVAVDPTNGKDYTNVAVLGADFNGAVPFAKVSGLTLSGDATIASTGHNSKFANIDANKQNSEWDAALGYTFGPVALKGGYKYIDAFFAAPGYWGTIGTWSNPTNVKGPVASATWTITPKATLTGMGSWYQGVSTLTGYELGDSPLNNSDRLTSYDAKGAYALTPATNVSVDYQWDQYNLNNDQGFLNKKGTPTETYLTFGIGHSLSANSSLRLLYQILNYSDKATGFDPEALNGDEKGSVALTQFDVKF